MGLFFKKNQFVDGHLHAWCLYYAISWKHFVYLAASVIAGKLVGVKTVTTHIPLELQHKEYPDKERASQLVRFGKTLAARFKIPLYWENAPLFNFGTWDLKHGQTDWNFVPYDIPLCFDTGHAILGTQSIEEARQKILDVVRNRHDQIRHLHVHENDLVHDSHEQIGKIITDDLLKKITAGRTYIFEK